MKVINQYINEKFAMYQGDCVEVTKGISDNSIHYSIFSPPFASLYTYSNSERDMGNSKTDDEFYGHFKYLISELFRILVPGRLVSFHCMDIPAMKSRDGFIGLKDFPALIRQAFEDRGFIYHSRVVIWKDPLIEATRTKSLGLMHKQIMKDSSKCRQGLPDYVITMKKPGENPEPITHPKGLTRFAGEREPKGGVYSHEVWRRYASPVWMDINQSNTLNKNPARDGNDEKHICPLQLDVIDRCLELWTNKDDIVFSPFAGIGSEGYMSLKMERRFIGIELKDTYYEQAVLNLKSAGVQKQQSLI